MEGLIKAVSALVSEEYQRAAAEHGGAANTPHEGYALIKEEEEEAGDQMSKVSQKVTSLWWAVKADDLATQQLHLSEIRTAGGWERMKAITIWQPWASLLAHRVKTYETRSWETSYRGPIAIHAAAIKVPQVLNRYFPGERERYIFLDAIGKGLKGCYTTEEIMGILNELPTSSVIATANLVGCHKISSPSSDKHFIRMESGWSEMSSYTELALGDWSDGRYAWEFSGMKLTDPVPAKGKQGLWNWGQEL